jgi:PKD repeat protein
MDMFQAVLTVTDDHGLSSRQSEIITIRGNPNPAAPKPSISADVISGVAPFEVQFTVRDLSTPIPQENITYRWYFDDGGRGFGPEMAHTFYQVGTYNVMVTAQNINNDVSFASFRITVTGESPDPLPRPVAIVTPKTPKILTGIEATAGARWKVELDASQSSVENGRISSYEGISGETGVLVGGLIGTYLQYLRTGTYQARVVVRADNGKIESTVVPVTIPRYMTDPQLHIFADSVIDLSEPAFLRGFVYDDVLPDDQLTYEWTKRWGAGEVTFANASQLDTTATFSQEGGYFLNMTVGNGLTTISKEVFVQVGEKDPTSPTARISVKTGSVTGPAPLTVTLSGAGSTDPNGHIVEYFWRFGGGGAAFGVETTPIFRNPGLYSVQLTVKDDDGLTDTTSILITAEGPPVPGAPDVVLKANPVSGEVPLRVQFDASESTDPDGDPLVIVWDFGDGSLEKMGVTLSHTFNEVGTYSVVLSVGDGRGNISYKTQKIVVSKPGTDPGDDDPPDSNPDDPDPEDPDTPNDPGDPENPENPNNPDNSEEPKNQFFETRFIPFKNVSRNGAPLTMTFEIGHRGHVLLVLYTLKGREVITLVNRDMPAGAHQVIWNLKNSAGAPVAADGYFLRLKHGDTVLTQKIAVLR